MLVLQEKTTKHYGIPQQKLTEQFLWYNQTAFLAVPRILPYCLKLHGILPREQFIISLLLFSVSKVKLEVKR